MDEITSADVDQPTIERCRELLEDDGIDLTDEEVDRVSKGRSDYYAYYHCRGRCRAVNINKAKLEELFVNELARLQPTAGFMRLVKDRVVHAGAR